MRTTSLRPPGIAAAALAVLVLLARRRLLVVRHRLDTVRLADRIAVLKGGQLAEHGTHEELMAAGGIYARMFSRQAQSFT